MLEKCNVYKLKKISPLYTKLKDKKAHDHPLDSEKAYEKVQHCFMINALETLGLQKMYLNMIKEVYSKPIATINLYRMHFKAILLKSGT